MLMVIFGAGASYDSSPDFPPPDPSHMAPGAIAGAFSSAVPPSVPFPPDPREAWRPPMTNNLFFDADNKFGSIVLAYPRLRGILPFLRRPQSGRSIEEQLELYLDESSTDQERTRQLFSVRYYLHDFFRVISEEWLKHTNRVTNYAVLIDQIRHLNTAGEPVCLVSFNYDLLLDHAVFPSGNSQPLELEFDAHPMFKVFKPHGSVDWSKFVTCPPGTRRTPDQLIDIAPTLTFSGEYVRANATAPTEMFNFNWPIVPAIAIPVQTKTRDTFEWPARHRTHFEELLARVRKILIIGWQGKEAHFLTVLRDKLPSGGLTQLSHLQVVGKDPAESSNISKRFAEQIGRNVMHIYAGPIEGFSNFVRREQVGFFFKE